MSPKPHRPRPGLITTAITAVHPQGADGNCATVGQCRRVGRHVSRQTKNKKRKSLELRVCTLNVGTMTEKAIVQVI